MFSSKNGLLERYEFSRVPSLLLTLHKQFIRGLNTQKYNTASRLRLGCARIFDVDEDDLRDPGVRREIFRNKIGWTGNGTSYSSVDVEVIPRNYTGKYCLYFPESGTHGGALLVYFIF